MLWLLSLLALASPRPSGVANGGVPSAPAGPSAPRPGAPGGSMGMGPSISGFAPNTIGPGSRGAELLDTQAGWRTRLTADWTTSRWAGASTPELDASIRGGETLAAGKLIDRMGRDLYIVPLRTDRVWDPSGACATAPARTAQRGAAKSRPMGAMADPWFGAVAPIDPRGVVAPGQGIRARVEGIDQIEVRVGPPGTDWTNPTAGVLLGPGERTATSTEGPLELAIRPLRRTSDGPRPAVWLAWGAPETCGGETAVDLGLGFEAVTVTFETTTAGEMGLPPTTWDGGATNVTIDMRRVATTLATAGGRWTWADAVPLDTVTRQGYLVLVDTDKSGTPDQLLAALGVKVRVADLGARKCLDWTPGWAAVGAGGAGTWTRMRSDGPPPFVDVDYAAVDPPFRTGNGTFYMGLGLRLPLETMFSPGDPQFTLNAAEVDCP